MSELRFWLVDWEHECCGDQRKVGDRITVSLSFTGSAESSDDPDVVQPVLDGQMVIVGEARRSVGTEPGWVVRSGDVEFGFPGDLDGPRVRCAGKLWEERHGSPGGGPAIGQVTGRISGMRWHPAMYERTSDGHSVVGYGEPTVISSTTKYPGFPRPVSPGLARLSEALKRGDPIAISPAPMEDYQPTGWAFEFIIEV